MKQVEALIVGSGIAGITLAWKLYQQQKSFVIISQPRLSLSSLVAPAVWNPIVFKRMNPTWNASVLLDELIFYQETEKTLQVSLVQSFRIWHILNNNDEEKLWLNKKELYPRFLGDIKWIDKNDYPLLKHSLKCGEVINAGRLNVSEYIYHSLQFFQSINAYVEDKFYYDRLDVQENRVVYNDLIARYVVFCEGYLVKNNPWFDFVKLKPAKGEIVEIETKQYLLPENTILHKHISIIPNGKNRYLIGSNYDWTNLNEEATASIKYQFLSEFEELFDVSYEVIGHYAGIRPAADRRPVLGQHPQYASLWIMNGLGTKGVLLAPYCAKKLYNAIYEKELIEYEISVIRMLQT